jgi:hypothetical protein
LNRACNQLVRLLVEPDAAGRLSAEGWDGIVRVARRSGLLGRLAVRLEDRDVEVPGEVRRHLESEWRIAAAHHGNVRWEVRRIVEALGTEEIPFLVLKGAAYVVADLPPARGRVFEDVDILVHREQLAAAESALGVHGWVTTHRHPYDQRYYRQWMHELPPMRHVRRGSSLDVHHRLLPLTAPLQPDPGLLWEAAGPLADWPGAHVPATTDLVLHAAAHLFFDGAFENGLRDLLDIDELLRAGGAEPGFWDRLVDRGAAMDLALPLADALCWSERLLGTPVPDSVRPARRRRSWPGERQLMDTAFAHGLRPEHPLCGGFRNTIARQFLYVRSHRLRMPLWRVVPHLVRKAVRPLESATG